MYMYMCMCTSRMYMYMYLYNVCTCTCTLYVPDMGQAYMCTCMFKNTLSTVSEGSVSHINGV